MTNLPTGNRSPARKSGSPEPSNWRDIRVTSSSEDLDLLDAVLGAQGRPGIVSSVTTGNRVPHKQVHTHSVRDLHEEEMSNDEGRIVDPSPPSMSPTGSSVALPVRPPSRSMSWRGLQLLRGWVSDSLPAVTLAVALGAFVCAAMTLSRPRAPPSGL
ncbi:hypothetical protein HPB50_012992 [Hyalomma asiaticum]|uniref:Uncharacterized protein n=1 Tax=Hyalomma asiaticum TaxID=266040 RepID=A0ACB7T620_HYAAI|nr:hypothetical protein HPB50_012992 [Hyalomma asiaticum]